MRRKLDRHVSLLAAQALSCFLLATSVSSAADSATIYYNAHVFTAEAAHPYADAVAIRGDRIVAVGPRQLVEREAGQPVREVDLGGRFLLPGLIDGHAHPIDGGHALTLAHFPDPGSVQQLVDFITTLLHRKQSFVGDTLVVRNLDTGYWPHAAEIDAVLSRGEFAKQPIVLYGSDAHTVWGNRTALRRAGVTARYIAGLDDEQRRFYGFGPGYAPNGFCVDVGQTKIDRSVPPASAAAMLEAGRAGVHYMNALGITAWIDAQASGVVGGDLPASVKDLGFLPVYRDLSRRGELTAHVVAYPVVNPNYGKQQIDVVQAIQASMKDVPEVLIPGLKVFADGVVEVPSQTAALSKPYTNTGRSVASLFKPDEFNALVSEAYRRGLTVHIHAIGDLAVKQSLDAFQAARKANPDTRLPFVITHVQFADPADIPRFGSLHVIAALQLLWAIADSSTIEQVKPYIDPDIYRTMYPARAILDAGGTIAGASDWAVSSANVFEAIAQAETRAGPGGVLDAGQRMPREAMLYAYTRNAAEALGKLDEIGTLAPGKRADLALIDRDVLTVSPDELKHAAVVFTMFGGKLIYGKEP